MLGKHTNDNRFGILPTDEPFVQLRIVVHFERTK